MDVNDGEERRLQVGNTEERGSRPWWIPTVVALALAVATALWLHGLATRAEAAWVPLFAVPWTAVALFALRCRTPPLWALVLAALATRLAFVGAPPLLSDDVYRYLAEGWALEHGINPFLVPPAELVPADGLPAELLDRVNHPAYTSLYPPVALLWFRLLSWVGTVSGAQLLTGLVDVLTVGAIAKLADRRWALVYALLPLGPLEAGLGAHLDAVAVAAAAWGAALLRTRPTVASALLVVGTGVKLLPGALIPPALRRGPLPAVLLGLGLGAGVLALGGFAVVEAGPALFRSLRAYGEHWSFNSLGLWMAEPLLGRLARPTLMGIGALFSLAILTSRRDALRTWLAVGSAFVLLTPTVHPWYLLWVVVPSLACRRWGWAAASGALLGSYAVLATLNSAGGWHEPSWLRPLTWLPALLLLAVSAVQARGERDAAPRRAS